MEFWMSVVVVVVAFAGLTTKILLYIYTFFLVFFSDGLELELSIGGNLGEAFTP
jgi:hypothetical protein